MKRSGQRELSRYAHDDSRPAQGPAAHAWWPKELAAFLVLILGLYAWGAWVVRKHATLLFRLATRGILLGAVLNLLGAALAIDLLSRAVFARECDR